MIKRCRVCDQQKPITEFYKSKRTKDGYNNICKPCKRSYDDCHINKENKRKYNREREIKLQRWKSPERQRDQRNRNLKRRYDLTGEQYDSMLTDQQGLCFICKSTNKDGRGLSVDHNHTTNEVRALLCGNCNLIVGNCKEDPAILLQVIEYLKLFNASEQT